MDDPAPDASLPSTLGGFIGAMRLALGRRAWGIAALVGGAALLEGAGIALLVPILTLVLGGGGTETARRLADLGPSAPPAQLAVLLALFLALMLLRALVLYRRDVVLAAFQNAFVADLRNKVLRTLAQAPWERVVALRHARVTGLLGEDVGRIAQGTHMLVQGTVAAVMLLVQLGIAAMLSPTIAGGVALILMAGAARTLWRTRRARDHGAAVVRANLQLLQETGGFLGGLKAAAAEDAGQRFTASFAARQAELGEHHLAFVRAQARSRATFALGSAAAAAAVVALGYALAIPGAMLAALLVLFARMAGPAATLQSAAGTIAFGLPSFAAIRALERGFADAAPPTAKAWTPPAGDIRMEAARYLHDGGGGIASATLTIAPGEIVGLAGSSGAGKTTLVDLLTGLIAPQSGSLAVGGMALDADGRLGWRRQIGYVAQDSFLHHDSIRANLDPAGTAVEAEIAAALAVAGADAIVAALPEGLATVIGERGARLSGGERQRLGIARALLRRPRLLVLDEATSAIDVAGEAALLARLAGVTPRPTIVIVAHRAESLAHCDRIVRVERGRIVS